ncbi:MAG: dihydroorotate dehydrogenase [Eubacteriales bacterium]
MSVNMKVNIAGIELKNPVMPASGTFMPKNTSEFYDITKLGAVVTKGVADTPWPGNPMPRIAETYGGMLNSIGLQNPGAEQYIKEDLEFLKDKDVPIISNIAGHSIDEYVCTCQKLEDTNVDMFEINISCPNIEEGGMSFGTDPVMAAKVTSAVKKITKKPVIVKLSPNVTDITQIAKAVETAGADAVSLINTLLGMRIDINRKKPILANKMGGFSGPAVFPVALRMVYQVRRTVNIPIIGMGGIMTWEDAVEMIMAGADAVAVGTAALLDPGAPLKIISGIEKYMIENDFKTIDDIRAAFCE